MKLVPLLFIAMLISGCTKSDKLHSAKLQKIEAENAMLRHKIELVHYFFDNPLDSSLLHTKGCYLPKIKINAPKTIALGDSFTAKVSLSQQRRQANLKLAESTVDSTSLTYNQECIVYTCKPTTRGHKVFKGDYTIHSDEGISSYAFEYMYEVK